MAIVSASAAVGVAAPAWAEGENAVPVANNDAYSTPMNTQLVVPNPGILSNDVDPDSILVLGGVDKDAIAGTVFVNNAGGFTYNPTAGFTGVTTFQYRAREVDTNQLSEWATVSITVVPPSNLPPVTVGDAYTTLFETPLVVGSAQGLLLNDSDPEGDPIVAVSDWVPSLGSFTSYSDQGTFTYVPPAGFSGDVTFSYRAFDHVTAGNYATVTITVLPAAEPEPVPVTLVAHDDLYIVTPGSMLFVGVASGVLANDVHSAGGDFEVLQHTAPIAGSFTLLDDGSFQWYSPDNFCSDMTFTYVAGNVDIASNVATVTLRADLGDDKSGIGCGEQGDLPGDEPGDESGDVTDENDQPTGPTIPTLPLPGEPSGPDTPGDETGTPALTAKPHRDELASTGADTLADGIGWAALVMLMLGLAMVMPSVRRSALG